MKLVNRQEQPLEFDGTSFTLRRNARPAEAHFRRWYIAEGSEWLKRRTTMLSRRTGASPARVEVRELGFRWGSCGKNGVLYFNWRILQLPARLIDYVIVHELVHLRERHHGPAFSAAIERAMPNWEDRKSALNRKAQEFLMFGLTSGDC
jgi:predicted metal-dependent hydrolase